MPHFMGRSDEERAKDAALAMAVYLAWNEGMSAAPLPSLSLQRWCNRELKRQVFPVMTQEQWEKRRGE